MKRAEQKRVYRRRIELSLLAALLLCQFVFMAFRFIEVKAKEVTFTPEVIIEVVPRTKQPEPHKPVQPPMPSVPVPVDDPAIPEDATILETSGLLSNFDKLPEMPEEKTVFQFWEISEKPVMIGQLKVVYPEMARKVGLEGKTTVEFIVDKDGRPQQASVFASSGSELLDQAAVAAVMQSRWQPAMQRDSRVAVWMQIPVVFRLR